MALKIAINGFGRIGRCVARIASKRDDIELVAINFSGTLEMLKYLLKYDSVHGEFDGEVKILDEDRVLICGQIVKVFSARELDKLDFASVGAEVVMECTGAFLTTEKCKPYLVNGVKKDSFVKKVFILTSEVTDLSKDSVLFGKHTKL